MPQRGALDTLGDRLNRSRRRLFVGRTAEIELFEAALQAEDAPFSVLFLHGPGGIGKTSLLDVLERSAREARARVVRWDGHALAAAPDTVQDAVAEIHSGAEPSRRSERAGGERLVLLIDSYERLDALDARIRDEVLPGLPLDAITVIAGRSAPGAGWRDDVGWQERLRSVSLRNLSSEESRDLLRRRGIGDGDVDRFVDLTHGHPLALSLLADVAARQGPGDGPPDDLMTADLIDLLLRRFVDSIPSGRHRRALEVCALARVTTETLLRDALELDDVHDLFSWLRGLSFVDAGVDGLHPHDLARDVLDLDLRWRDPEEYRRTFRRVRRHVHGAFASPDPRIQQRALFDEKFIFRNLPGVLSPVDWDSWGLHFPEPARPEDRDQILALVTAAEGPESAGIAARWLDAQPDGFHVLRERSGAIRGVLGLLDLTSASSADLDADPATRTAWEHANRTVPVRAGEVVTQTRFIVDRDRYQDPSPTMNATPVVTLQRYLQMRGLALDYLTLAEPDGWDEYFALADLPRVRDADFSVGGRRFGLFCHDFRTVPVDALIELWTERVLTGDFSRPAPGPPTAVVPSQADFAAAVRQALRDLNRPDLLARSPLLRTRLLLERAAPAQPSGDTLAALLHDAASTLRTDPRDDALWQAVQRTYFGTARTQEAVAMTLGLPFSTYRRHLTRGVSRIVEWCWDREIHGWPTPRPRRGRQDRPWPKIEQS